MKTIAFLTIKVGLEKPLLHFIWDMLLKELGKKVLFADLDPQCNLTAHILF